MSENNYKISSSDHFVVHGCTAGIGAGGGSGKDVSALDRIAINLNMLNEQLIAINTVIESFLERADDKLIETKCAETPPPSPNGAIERVYSEIEKASRIAVSIREKAFTLDKIA